MSLSTVASTLKVDLTSLKTVITVNKCMSEVKIGADDSHYTLKIDENTKHFIISDPNDNIIIEHTESDLILNGKLLNAIWQTLENH